MIRTLVGFGLIDLFTDIQEQVDKYNGNVDTFEAFNNETQAINHHENTLKMCYRIMTKRANMKFDLTH